MASNLEIKYKLDDFRSVRRRISKIRDLVCSKEIQEDIYYKVKSGRLKLRIINNETGHLIHYIRVEKSSKRISRYEISKTSSFKELDSILRSQFQILTIVKKNRIIFTKENIRLHLDTLKDLGKFLEIEIIYKNISKARKQMEELICLLKLNEKNFIKTSYSDLLIKQK
ncbi:MAG: class IV adenylate cyclase [Ignavibacteria bacterium]